MAQKEVLTIWDRENRNNLEHNFNELFGEMGNIVETISEEAVQQIIDSAKINWLEPVTTKAELPSTANIGDAIMVSDNGEGVAEVYRYSGSDWELIQQFDPTAINELDKRITLQLETKADDQDIIDANLRIDEIPISEYKIETTTGRDWSTQTNELRYTLNSEKVTFQTPTDQHNKKIVIFGSSTAEGFYGTEGNSWWEKLRDSLNTEGWEILQRSLSGDDTSGGISRFHKDVIPYNPDICIIAFTLGNEGMNSEQTLPEKEATLEQFKANILTIAATCKQHGIFPIIADQFPTKRYNAEIYRLAAELNKEIDRLGFMTINFKGAIDAILPNGVPLNLAMHDDLHPNDAGHNSMFKSIPLDMFKYISAQRKVMKIEENQGFISTPDLDAGIAVRPIEYVPQDTFETFTMFFRLRANQAVELQRTWAGIGDELRISNQDSANHELDLRGGGMSGPIISDVGLDDLDWHSICVTFSGISKAIKFYIDGNLIGADTSETLTVPQITLAGRSDGVIGKNASFKDFAVYKSRLSDEQVKDLHNGIYSIGSLHVFAPFSDQPSLDKRMLNLAPTGEYVRINTGQLIGS
ncbi:GDSL-type esterase/lipase family protein [Virgibacillus salexigens]|uniref:SGNH hydrolase-type esterase domain-containing protein n=1 Tax=Virgibacillus massiliensis TaxID=1462526 RepID=A0A024QAQ0_9BACI|nr:GDSL-type esterase/lipase family protein [Virgibacillus massiliensis]CDQ39559.1 hypothetical protein BN990_01864 [Virgibacillus massiliensis]